MLLWFSSFLGFRTVSPSENKVVLISGGDSPRLCRVSSAETRAPRVGPQSRSTTEAKGPVGAGNVRLIPLDHLGFAF